MKKDYTIEWLDFYAYELNKKIKRLREKLEKERKIHEGLTKGVENEYDTE
jgi:cell division protein FtsL